MAGQDSHRPQSTGADAARPALAWPDGDLRLQRCRARSWLAANRRSCAFDRAWHPHPYPTIAMRVRTLLHVFATFAGRAATALRPDCQSSRKSLSARYRCDGWRYRRDGAASAGSRCGTARGVGATRTHLDQPKKCSGGYWRGCVRILLVTSNWGSIEWAIANLDSRVRHLHLEDGFGPEETDRQLLRRVCTRFLVLRRSTVVVPSRTLYAVAGMSGASPHRACFTSRMALIATGSVPSPMWASRLPPGSKAMSR